MGLLGAWGPVGLGDAGQVVPLDLIHGRLVGSALPKLRLGSSRLEILVDIGPVGVGKVRLLFTRVLLRLHRPAVVTASPPSAGHSDLKTNEE